MQNDSYHAGQCGASRQECLICFFVFFFSDNIVKEYQFSEDNIPADVIMHQKWEEVFQENETEVRDVM